MAWRSSTKAKVSRQLTLLPHLGLSFVGAEHSRYKGYLLPDHNSHLDHRNLDNFVPIQATQWYTEGTVRRTKIGFSSR